MSDPREPASEPTDGQARRLRVLHVLPDLAVGGGQSVVLEIARTVDRQRFDLRVAYCMPPADLAPDFQRLSIAPVALGYDPLAFAAGPRLVRRLARYLRRERIDVVHVHSDLERRAVAAAAWITRTPVVTHVHALWFHLGVEPGASVKRRVAVGARRSLEFHTTRAYVATSDSAASFYRDRVRAPITVYSPGLDLDRFAKRDELSAERRAAIRREFDVPDSVPMLLSVARMVPGKGNAELLDVLERVRDHESAPVLVFVGDGPELEGLESDARRRGLREQARFVGVRHDVPTVLAASDLFVFASQSESLGIAVLEAMAVGVPQVAFDLPPFRAFVVPEETTRLVRLGDVDAFAAAVRAFLDDPASAIRMGHAARRAVEAGFDGEQARRDLEAVYERVAR